jgi:hypothetical protein
VSAVSRRFDTEIMQRTEQPFLCARCAFCVEFIGPWKTVV